MQLNKFTDYALRVLIHLAVARDARLSAREIAAMQGISFNHLAKVTQWLAAEGYVTATRGRNGGMTLARPAPEISIGAVVRRAEADTALVECMRNDGGACCLAPACALTGMLAEAQEAFFATLDKRTLADVVALRPGIAKLIGRLEAENNTH